MATAITHDTTAIASKVMSRNAKLVKEQKGVLAQAGLNYDEVFSVSHADFGHDLLDSLMPKVQELAAKVASVHVQAGFPASLEADLVEAITKSFSVTAGLNEAARAIGIATYEETTGQNLPSDFFGGETATPTAAERKTLSVEMAF